MARKFKNVSPFGDLHWQNRLVPHGDVIEVGDEWAERFAEQELNWSEVLPETKGSTKPADAE